jgi:hypothetical protein
VRIHVAKHVEAHGTEQKTEHVQALSEGSGIEERKRDAVHSEEPYSSGGEDVSEEEMQNASKGYGPQGKVDFS